MKCLLCTMACHIVHLHKVNNHLVHFDVPILYFLGMSKKKTPFVERKLAQIMRPVVVDMICSCFAASVALGLPADVGPIEFADMVRAFRSGATKNATMDGAYNSCFKSLEENKNG